MAWMYGSGEYRSVWRGCTVVGNIGQYGVDVRRWDIGGDCRWVGGMW